MNNFPFFPIAVNDNEIEPFETSRRKTGIGVRRFVAPKSAFGSSSAGKHRIQSGRYSLVKKLACVGKLVLENFSQVEIQDVGDDVRGRNCESVINSYYFKRLYFKGD